MVRGTTPSFKFTLPFKSEQLTDINVAFAQNHEVIISKDLESCSLGEFEACVTLTQEETLLFESGVFVEIQIRAKLTDNTAIASNIFTIPCSDVLVEGAI